VHLMFCDYRDCPGEGTYDKVVSIEMIEAVGHEHLVPYFRVVGRMLKTVRARSGTVAGGHAGARAARAVCTRAWGGQG
jgi:cyclopropane fatty-acyl-phospholipid synthase-like methyltransferase